MADKAARSLQKSLNGLRLSDVKLHADPGSSDTSPVLLTEGFEVMESTALSKDRSRGESSPAETSQEACMHSRRDVVRQGVKLAFVAPVLSTFFARDAVAAGSNHSCYPIGQACGAHEEDCCSGNCDGGFCAP